MNGLVIFYSLNGNTRLLAESIARTTGYDIAELQPVKDVNPEGVMKYIFGGASVFMKRRPRLESLAVNVQDYEVFFMGTPVWAGSYAPAFNTFFAENRIENKQVALFCCHAGAKGNVFDKFKQTLGDSNAYLGEKDFVEPLKSDTEIKTSDAINWAKTILTSLDTEITD
jgi:flavodoxin